MTNQVYYDYNIMREFSRKIKDEREVITSIENDMNLIIKDLSGAIEGESQIAYIRSHENLIKQYKKLDKILDSLCTSIDQARNNMDTTDRRLANDITNKFSEFTR